MFHVFVLASPPLDDVTFEKLPFGKMSGGLRKNPSLSLGPGPPHPGEAGRARNFSKSHGPYMGE